MAQTGGAILIVDDIEPNRIALQDLCEVLGHSATLAENGREALDRMREQVPEIVLLDIMMPEMDGHEVLRKMKEDNTLRDLPVIMISALDDLDNVVRCIEAGADDYLIKPFNRTLLAARIGACLEKKRFHDRERELHAELVASHAALQESEKTRIALTHMIVHDLNNPLTSLMAFSSMILGAEGLDAQVEADVVRINVAARGMHSLIGGILDVSKLEANEMPISPVAFNATELAHDVVEQFSARAEQADVEISFEAAADEIALETDKDLLRRVLENLVGNGLKYTLRGAHLGVFVKEEEDLVTFTVADDGPGIPAEFQERIFDKYFQIDGEGKRIRSGVGLGLAFCKMAVDALGGRIWVESEEGGGARFNVALKH